MQPLESDSRNLFSKPAIDKQLTLPHTDTASLEASPQTTSTTRRST